MARSRWHPEQIKAEVRLRTGKSLSQLSLENGLPEHAFRTALYRTCYPEAEDVMAGILKRSPQELWPGRFREDGTRRFPARTKPNANTIGPSLSVADNKEAA